MIDLTNDFVEDKIEIAEEPVKKKYKAPKGSTNPLTPEQEAGVVKMYKRGEKVVDIINKHGIASGRIYRILARNGIDKRNPEYNREGKARALTLSKYEKDRIVDEYIRKVPIRDIMAKYGLNKYGLYIVLDERKITRQTEKETETTVKVHKQDKKRLPVDAYIQDKIVYVKIHKDDNEIEQIRVDYV